MIASSVVVSARAIAAQKRDDLTLSHVERNALQHVAGRNRREGFNRQHQMLAPRYTSRTLVAGDQIGRSACQYFAVIENGDPVRYGKTTSMSCSIIMMPMSDGSALIVSIICRVSAGDRPEVGLSSKRSFGSPERDGDFELSLIPV
jgi:hypothetical protein